MADTRQATFLKDLTSNEEGPEYEYDEFADSEEEPPIQPEYKVSEPHKYYSSTDD